MRSACTVPHTVPVSFREAHVGRCVLPGGQVCGAGVQGCSERLCENPEFANRVPTSTPRAWGAHAARHHFLLSEMSFLGLAPHRSEFSHSLSMEPTWPARS